MTEGFHEPVMVSETMSYLLQPDPAVCVDCTLGDGGHTLEILKRKRDVYVIGFDVDSEALRVARKRLAREFDGRFSALKADYRDMSRVLAEFGAPRVDAVLYDLGVSSRQLDTPERGFSYWGDQALDMRMNTDGAITAKDIVATYSGEELTRILREYGEERFAPRIAREIVKAREVREICTADELVELVKRAIPVRARTGGGHPARKTFQALRIAVNDELRRLARSLEDGFFHLKPLGVMAVLSYHSLEDRIVKETFKRLHDAGEGERLTKKPLSPSEAEVARNARARSARLRVMKRKMNHGT
jgi:16S rRNA (cytosine1402-N4)-methyltransferase